MKRFLAVVLGLAAGGLIVGPSYAQDSVRTEQLNEKQQAERWIRRSIGLPESPSNDRTVDVGPVAMTKQEAQLFDEFEGMKREAARLDPPFVISTGPTTSSPPDIATTETNHRSIASRDSTRAGCAYSRRTQVLVSGCPFDADERVTVVQVLGTDSQIGVGGALN